MKPNEGSADRIARVVFGLVAIAVAAALLGITTIAGIIVAAIGLVLLVTGAVGFCPAYAVFGMKTCPISK